MMSSWWSESFPLEEYKPPAWAKHFNGVPTYRLKLSQLPTPIHRWNVPNIPKEFELFIKRDDLTGSTLSGNKVRKLDFFLADIVEKGYKDIVTTGSMTSNHCRTTALAATQLGLRCHLVMRSQIQDPDEIPCTDNLFLSRLAGAHMYFVNQPICEGDLLERKQQEVAKDIKLETGKSAYIVPLGGSETIGVFGYIEAYNEMVQQGILDNITDIVLACGTVGSIAGVAIANHVVCGDKIRVHGFKIAEYTLQHLYNNVRESLDFLGLKGVDEKKLFQLNVEYLGKGYGATTPKQLEFMAEVSTSTGIILDHVYTGKTAYGMVCEMINNPHVFKGRRVLFIHTGGIFGFIQSGCMDDIVKKPGAATNRCNISK